MRREPDVTYQCQALSAKTKQRCTRDATFFTANRSYCQQHHEIHLNMLKDKYAEECHEQKRG